MRRNWVGVPLMALVAAASVAVAVPAGRAADRRPNILLIVADDYGYADSGMQGCRDIPTPNIDAIARAGVRCTNGYVSGPYCSPTRSGLLTGRYQQRYGNEFNPGPPEAGDNSPRGLALSETTLAQRLRSAGYATGLVGKWHLGAAEKFHPTNRGFGEYFGFLGGAHSYLDWDVPRDPIQRGRTRAADTSQPYLTEAFGREAVAFMERHREHPFLLYLAFNAVHVPMQAPAAYLERFPNLTGRRKTYAAMTSAMDDAIGGVMARLRELRLEQNTLVFFISDNGGPELANSSDNGPLRGQKAQTWEGGIRVPFLASWKGRLPAGQTYDHPVIQLDIAPTALAAAGVKLDAGARLDGVDLMPYLRGRRKQPPHQSLYWRFGPQMAIRMGDWKLVKAPGAGAEFRENASEKATAAGAHLYNLRDDIGEQTNLSAQQPDRVKTLTAAWEKWNAEMVEPAFQPGRPRAAARAARVGRR